MRRLPFIFLLASFLCLLGCRDHAPLQNETDEKDYRQGVTYLRENRQDEALGSFLAVIASRADAAESNLEVGLIYLNHLKDPISAIYHFRKYLEVKPNAEHSERVRELIDTARKEFAKSLPGQPFGEQGDKLDVMASAEKLQTENIALKQQVASLTAQLQKAQSVAQARTVVESPAVGSTAGLTPVPVGTPAPASGRTYVVQPGDTLSKISAKVYGVPTRWQEIYNANRDVLPNQHALKLGQTLKIP